MIRSFKHKGLERLWVLGDEKAFNKQDIERIKIRLSYIHRARSIEDINIPGFKLHELKGNRKGVYSITVRSNYRITFKFNDGDAYILNYEDYH
ncbi:Killer protein [Salmonella enterica]|nr:Killer protein [Salmonella enterica]EIG8968196.1 type II toxin-antitoxin system RelE/ParE family toxin [Salmonella enterica]EJK8888592.1 type II toxin-antitoxin system RelE/ParE family toxin [Salmonella enterica]